MSLQPFWLLALLILGEKKKRMQINSWDFHVNRHYLQMLNYLSFTSKYNACKVNWFISRVHYVRNNYVKIIKEQTFR